MPCQGAYTLRPESAVISGIGYVDQGFDRFHPYLKPSRLAAAALPRLLSRAGLDTIFIHPHDGSFFRRDRAMPQFGFNRFVDEGAFCDTKRVGPYVSDEAVGEFLTVELKKSADAKRPIFLYAVTMEAHDPFGPGRLVNEDDPVRQYIHHIENADRMLACLEQDIATHHDRVLLVFFGDHVPFLPSFCDPFPDTRTDYFAIELGRNAKNYKYDAEVSRPEHLHGLIIRSLERRGCT